MLYPSFRRIEVFVAVAERGSFSGAAQQLSISQPSVSEHIRALENSLGEVLLLRRSGRRAQLTPAGEALLARARSLLQQVAELATQASAGRQRRIVIAAQRRLSSAVLPALLAGFASSHPQAELIVRSGTIEEVLALLQSGEADLGYFLANAPLAGLESTVVTREAFVFVAAPDHPLARRRRIAPQELASQRFIRGAAGTLFGRELDALLASVGLDQVAVASRSTDEAIIRQLVASGVGIHFNLAKSVALDLRAGLVRQLAVDAPPLTLALRQAVGARSPSPLTAQFCRFAEAHWVRC